VALLILMLSWFGWAGQWLIGATLKIISQQRKKLRALIAECGLGNLSRRGNGDASKGDVDAY
jgi:hypothetical protein